MTNKIPGVYIEEISSLPRTVAQVETAIPGFVGYTEIAVRATDDDLHLIPTKIRSMQEYEQYFGGPQRFYGETRDAAYFVDVALDHNRAVKRIDVDEPGLVYLLYYAMKLYFDNGGAACYVVSVGVYDSQYPQINLSDDAGATAGLMDGLDALKEEDGPALIVIPEAVQLSEDAQYQALVQAMLSQCNDLRDRFSILDLRGGNAPIEADNGNTGDSVQENNSLNRNRSLFGMHGLNYGAAYYPFLKTGLNFYVDQQGDNVQVRIDSASTVTLASLRSRDGPIYHAIRAALDMHTVVLPPSAAIAAVYAAVDQARGVWKAPSNVGLSNVVEPLFDIDNGLQEAMNVAPNSGKSINAIRRFSGRGVMVWGARTLAGNDNEWRYVPVSRLCIMIEASLKKSTAWVAFESNDAATWGNLRMLVERYLNGLWRKGGLMGSNPSQAFFVQCGLGASMTQQDILEGRIIVEIGVAPVRPAEFIIIRVSQLVGSAS